MANVAKDPAGSPVQVAPKRLMVDARFRAVLARVIAEVPGVDTESAAARWLAGPAERELDRLRAPESETKGA